MITKQGLFLENFFEGGRRNVLTDFLFFVTRCLLEFQVITENTRWTACENRVGRD